MTPQPKLQKEKTMPATKPEIDPEVEFMQKYLAPLRGASIISTRVAEDDGAWPILCVRTADGRYFELEISRDPEGNGPGWISGLPPVNEKSAPVIAVEDTPDPLASLRPHFDITPNGSSLDQWILRCKRCKQGYALGKKPDGSIHGGNVLSLLNHAASHPTATKKAAPKKRQRAKKAT